MWHPLRRRVRWSPTAGPSSCAAKCDECLRRLGTDRVELLYLHSPDEKVPIEESAAALRELQDAGKTRSVGVSNFTLEQIEAFHAVCPLSAVQLPYNMLQRDIEQRTIPWCRENNIAVMVYWPLMKGLLAGKLPRDGTLDPRDNRRNYPIYHDDEWQKNQDFIDAPARSGRPDRPHGRAARRQLDDSSARHHGRPLRREAAVANHRNRRRDGLDADERAASTHRRSDRRPRRQCQRSAAVLLIESADRCEPATFSCPIRA